VAPARVRTPLLVVLASAFAAVMVVVLPGTQAHAEPTVTEIEAKIRQIWLQAEPLIEEYNGVHEQYKKNRAKQDALKKKIEPLQRQMDLAQLRVGVLAAQVYRGGQADAVNAMLSSGSPQVLAEQLSFLDYVARDQERQLKGISDLKANYDAQKTPIDTLVATLAQQDADLAKRKKAIEAQLTELQRLRRQLYGTTSGTGSFRPWPCPASYEPTKGYQAAKFACTQTGKPYVWAADGPSSYDCSGLTLAAWRAVKVYLPHQSSEQRASIPYVSRANLKIGDLVFYYRPIHHVGIYVGDNKIVHAPSAGDYVRMANMDDSGPINSFGRPS
jgi:peptidoglycan DL-endopeptidase CwlO